MLAGINPPYPVPCYIPHIYMVVCACEVKVGHGPRHVVEGECVELERRELRQQLLGRGGHLRSKVVISVGTYVVVGK